MDDAERAFRDALHRVDSVRIPVPSLEPAAIRRAPGLGLMMGRWLAAAAVVAVVAGLAVWALAGRGQSVTAVPAGPPSTASSPKLTGTTWLAVQLYGKATEGAQETLPFLEFRPDSTYHGGDPCNGLSGSYRLVGDELTISPPGAMTAMGCEVTQQQAFMRAIDATRRVYRDRDTLELLDLAGGVLARFRSSEAHNQPGSTVTPTPTDAPSPEVTPAIGPAPAVWVRIRNASSIDFTDVYVVFPTGEEVHYGPIPAGAASRYESVLKAYSYSYLKVTAAGRSYIYQPVDYVGESELPNGHYGYVLDVVDGRIDLKLEHD